MQKINKLSKQFNTINFKLRFTIHYNMRASLFVEFLFLIVVISFLKTFIKKY